MSRLLITGTNSGCGKTTVTCAMLAALSARGVTPTAFKCGPDYIDPTFHRAASGIEAYNLDPFFLDGNGLRSHLAAHGGQFSIIEGAMGYYDGIAATDEASAYTVARETGTPVILVVSTKGAGHSLSAMIEGYARHRLDSQIKGVIFNDASENRYPDLQQIAEDTGVRAYGFMPHRVEWELPSRYLGLYSTDEIENLQSKLSGLGRQAELTLDMDGLIALAKTSPDLSGCMDEQRRVFCGATSPKNVSIKPQHVNDVRLAVAKDDAFCFLYEENLELLRDLGCELVFFSPLKDHVLPANINGLYLCGGYPEMYAKTLSENKTMLESIKQTVQSGLPTIAEGGGFLYLHETLDSFPMCGVIQGTAFETKKLQRFGYITLTAEHDNLMCKAGDSIRSREIHYWDSDCPGSSFTAYKKGRDVSYACVHATESLYAGFPHLYFPAKTAFAERFVGRMAQYVG